MDKTSFWWVGLCGICHPGGGPSEYDRDGELYYDMATSQFGYQKLGRTQAQVEFDGDYSEVNTSNGTIRYAPWDKTGVAEADCMYCHRSTAMLNGGNNMSWVMRSGTLRKKDGLKDASGGDVPAYATAATSAQGWVDYVPATVPAGKPPLADTVTVNYDKGVGNDLENRGGTLFIVSNAIDEEPLDYACWGCHLKPEMVKRGRKWFDATADVHYAAFNNLDDADMGNDISADQSRACTACHPSGRDHEIAKGNATLGSARNDVDYVNFRTCRDCHMAGPDKHPDAPTPSAGVHTTTAKHLGTMSCEVCHIPFKTTAATLVTDNAATGGSINYGTGAFPSEDPLDPGASDADGKWYPSFVMKTDKDGVDRMFPVKLLRSVWWGDWDQTNDVVRPIALWRVRQAIAAATPAVADNNGDTINEVNTEAEILAYIAALKADDVHNNPVAAIPVLVKGGKIWYDDGGSLGVLDYHAAGIAAESGHPFSINHNVTKDDAISACGDCHRSMNGGNPAKVFDRPILIDPFDESGNPVYDTVRDITGLSPN
jgi:hypothetical protein